MPIGNFVVDFACPAARLIIEVDGSHHGAGEALVRDRKRTEWLELQGYRVLRFWNNDVNQNINGVMEMIHAGLYGSREPRGFLNILGIVDLLTTKRSPHPGALRAPTLPLQGRVKAWGNVQRFPASGLSDGDDACRLTVAQAC